MYKTKIGLEIHAQLSTKTKAFCGCQADVFELEPNTAICPVCTGQPGALPVLNEKVVEYALTAALALNCSINLCSSFDRKNYFYPDLPKGYQITQYFTPIAENGYIVIGDNNNKKKIRIRRIHIEEDAGKLIHQGSSSISGASTSLVDLNRCGVPLIEIVTEPDIESPSNARKFIEILRDILRYLEICSGDMEKGALRCDANISIFSEDGKNTSNVVEVKNMNSFKFVEKALEFEKDRISSVLNEGKNIPHETRTWDSSTKTTISMRSKEEENDYRYFPEPDLPPLIIEKPFVEELKKHLPELPWEKEKRFINEYGLPEYDAGVLAKERALADFFEAVVKKTDKPKETSNWIMTEYLREIKELGKDIKDLAFGPDHFKELFDLMDSGKISQKIAKDVFSRSLRSGKMPSKIVKEKGLVQINDEEVIEKILKEAMKENEKAVRQYREGKKGVLGYFIGAVMKETKGKANPELVNEIARRLLESEEK
ncbi:MAG: Asp-tRNA(Asn)/Glu-tRNA(Gln) amidotransferase subunit GatB [Thermotogota bacterium]|nr:Asp-tRNA(Asn)/Glu-tRNA(Gln) amidotransferase subunit GatB [Thermotogota bacterium]